MVNMSLPASVQRAVANEFKGRAQHDSSVLDSAWNLNPSATVGFNISFGLLNHNADVLSV
jgi:hypothetical protein